MKAKKSVIPGNISKDWASQQGHSTVTRHFSKVLIIREMERGFFELQDRDDKVIARGTLATIIGNVENYSPVSRLDEKFANTSTGVLNRDITERPTVLGDLATCDCGL
jgi:hypothetical protein